MMAKKRKRTSSGSGRKPEPALIRKARDLPEYATHQFIAKRLGVDPKTVLAWTERLEIEPIEATAGLDRAIVVLHRQQAWKLYRAMRKGAVG